MTTTTATRAATVDLDELQAAAETRRAELAERRQILSLDALASTKAAAELAKLEREVADVDAQLGQIGLARQERGRREAAAAAAAEEKRKAEALERARELQAKRETAAKRFDKAAAVLAAATEDFCSASVEQAHALEVAGIQAAGHGFAKSLSPWMLEAALHSALDRRPGVLRAFEIRWSYIRIPDRRPLAELIGRPVDPK
jgi:hypothetical protein